MAKQFVDLLTLATSNVNLFVVEVHILINKNRFSFLMLLQFFTCLSHKISGQSFMNENKISRE